jgi:FkbM family methyltransferase
MRDFVHRKIAKKVTFKSNSSFKFEYKSSKITLLHHGSANYLYWLNEYEPESVNYFCEMSKKSKVIFDIGANDGIYSILASLVNPSAKIYAFEPGEHIRKICEQNIVLNSDTIKNVEIIPFALSDVVGRLPFYNSSADSGTSSLSPDFRSNTERVEVEVTTGDKIVEEHQINKVDLIKIDTESTEPLVLTGLLKTIKRDEPDIICEVLHGRTEEKLEDIMRPLGYKFYWMSNEGLLLKDKIVGDPTYKYPNYFFTKREI